MADYNFIRQVRSDVGDANVIWHHDSWDAWDPISGGSWDQTKYSGLKAVFLDAYVNYTLTGEDGTIAEVDHPNDSYCRYFSSGYGLSQAYGEQMFKTNFKAAISTNEITRVLGENLNCIVRACDNNIKNPTEPWVNYFKPIYDAPGEVSCA